MNAVPGQSLLQQHRLLQLLLETFSVCAQAFSTFMCRTLSNLDETLIILALFFAVYNAFCLF